MIKESIGIVNLLFKTLEFFGVKYIPKKQKVEKYINEILKYIMIIVYAKDMSSDEANFAHEMVKKYYNSSPRELGDIVSANTLAKVLQALSAARVYYWVKFFKDQEKSEIIALLDDRRKRIDLGIVRHNSPEILLQKIRHLKDDDIMSEHVINQIRDTLFADIAELEEHQWAIAF